MQLKNWVITLSLAVFSLHYSFAQQFSNLYTGGRSFLRFHSIEQRDNDFYVNGFTVAIDSPYYYKGFFGKTDEAGNAIFMKGIIDSLPYEYAIHSNSLHQTADGNFITCGELADGYQKIFIAKFDTAGNIIFKSEYADTGLILYQAMDVVDLGNQGYLIAANVEHSNYTNSVVIMRIDTAGNIIASKMYDLLFVEFPWVIKPMMNGNFMVGAVTYPTGAYYANTWLIEIDSMGNKIGQWIGTDNMNYWPYGMQQTADSGWIMVRKHIAYYVSGFQAYNASILKLDKNFNKEWEIDTGGISVDAGMYDVEILPDGNYICCGANPIDITPDSSHIYGWIMKVSATGQIMWQKNYLADEHYRTFNYLYDIDILPNGDLLACGELDFTYNVGITPTQQGWILRTDSNGCVLDNCLVGIEEPAPPSGAGGLQIQPNPANDYVEIVLPDEMLNGEVKVYDVTGKLVKELKVSGFVSSRAFQRERFRVDVSDLGKGVYVVVAEKQGKFARGKLIVE